MPKALYAPSPIHPLFSCHSAITIALLKLIPDNSRNSSTQQRSNDGAHPCLQTFFVCDSIFGSPTPDFAEKEEIADQFADVKIAGPLRAEQRQCFKQGKTVSCLTVIPLPCFQIKRADLENIICFPFFDLVHFRVSRSEANIFVTFSI